MRARSIRTIVSALLLVMARAHGEEFRWKEVTPASQGMSAETLESLKDMLAQRGTKALLVIRNDAIVCASGRGALPEAHAPGSPRSDDGEIRWRPDRRRVFSTAELAGSD